MSAQAPIRPLAVHVPTAHPACFRAVPCTGMAAAYIMTGPLLKPDVRRAGCRADTIFRGPGWTLVRLKGSLQDVGSKVSEGANFFARGLRLMGTDLSVAGRYFSRAALGACAAPKGSRPVLQCFVGDRAPVLLGLGCKAQQVKAGLCVACGDTGPVSDCRCKGIQGCLFLLLLLLL